MTHLQKMDASKIELLKRTVCKGASDDELEMFLYQCARTGLDPFSKQIYSIPRGKERTIQTAIDGFRVVADRTGNYAPGKETVYAYDKEGRILSATAYVMKRNNDGTWHEVSATAFYEEYKPKYESAFWKNMPRVMLAKCAESQALRRAFPADLSGLVTKEEMDQADKIEKEEALARKEELKKQEEDAHLVAVALDICNQIHPENPDSVYEYITHKRAIRSAYLQTELPLKFDHEKFLKYYTKWLDSNKST